jgi:hypothetical protein
MENLGGVAGGEAQCGRFLLGTGLDFEEESIGLKRRNFDVN